MNFESALDSKDLSIGDFRFLHMIRGALRPKKKAPWGAFADVM